MCGSGLMTQRSHVQILSDECEASIVTFSRTFLHLGVGSSGRGELGPSEPVGWRARSLSAGSTRDGNKPSAPQGTQRAGAIAVMCET